MKYVRYRIKKLTKSQKQVLDCHQIVKNRYLHTGVIESEVELGNYNKHYQLKVLPKEAAFKHERYFDTDYPCSQSWERPIHYHYIGEVDFLGTTTYCNQETKSLLSTAGYTTRPNINYRYRNIKGKVESVHKCWLPEVSKRARTERKVRRAWRRLQGENYVDPYRAVQTDSTEEGTDREESDMDETPAVLENRDTEEQAATDSDTSEPVGQPSVTEVQPEVIDTTNQAQLTVPGDYATQDEETYEHYYSARGLNQVKTDKEESDTEENI